MTEQSDSEAMRATLKEWVARWVPVDPPEEYGAASATIRRHIVGTRDRILRFASFEGPFLPSRVLFRRMVEMDDTLIRNVYAALSARDRDSIDAEARASVEKHGSVEEAHRARLIRDRFGIPRL